MQVFCLIKLGEGCQIGVSNILNIIKPFCCADAMTLSSIEQWREKAKEMGGGRAAAAKVGKKDAKVKETRTKVGAPMATKFAGRSPDVWGLALPSRLLPLGALHYLIYIISFAFYLFCRSTTITTTEVKVRSVFASWGSISHCLTFHLRCCCCAGFLICISIDTSAGRMFALLK
jgi:hypothetical protein